MSLRSRKLQSELFLRLERGFFSTPSSTIVCSRLRGLRSRKLQSSLFLRLLGRGFLSSFACDRLLLRRVEDLLFERRLSA